MGRRPWRSRSTLADGQLNRQEAAVIRTVRYFSSFAGIGGFELGIQQAAESLSFLAECVGYSEIDKHAVATYERRFPGHRNFGDITTLEAESLPDFELFVGGFPCQAFSIGGKRLGFEDTRGTLFFDVARILAAKRPQNFILENVKGLLSHDGGRTFRVIIRTLTELGYLVEWQVLNSKDHQVPQSRERVYIVGHLGGLAGRAVLPFAGQGNPHSTVGVSTETAVARTFTAGGNSGGNHSGMTVIHERTIFPFMEGNPARLQEITKARSVSQRVYLPELCQTLNPGAASGGPELPKFLMEERIRRLSITEQERLQGFPDDWTEGSSVTQRSKQIGNAVSVPVVRDVTVRLYEIVMTAPRLMRTCGFYPSIGTPPAEWLHRNFVPDEA